MKKILPNKPSVEFLVPMDLGKLIHPLGRYKFQEAAWYQQYSIPNEGLRITFLPAIHWNRRGLFDYNDMLWGSFMLETPNYNLYFAGDSAYGSHFREIRAAFPNLHLDTVVMPIGAYKPSVIMKASHVNPEEAVQAFNDLQADNFVPMHFGTYDLSDEPMGEPIRWLRSLEQKGRLEGSLIELAVGEEFSLKR